MNSPFQLFLLGFVFVFFIAGLDGVGFVHKLSVFGFAIPASALVINAAVEVDPYLAGLRGRLSGRWRSGGGSLRRRWRGGRGFCRRRSYGGGRGRRCGRRSGGCRRRRRRSLRIFVLFAEPALFLFRGGRGSW